MFAADESTIAYLCDRRQCEVCHPECSHTNDISHAKSFVKIGDAYFEENVIERNRKKAAEAFENTFGFDPRDRDELNIEKEIPQCYADDYLEDFYRRCAEYDDGPDEE